MTPRPRIAAPRTLVLVAALLVAAIPAGAVSGTAITTVNKSEAESGATVSHTVVVEAVNVTADGATDTAYLVLPDVYAGNISPSSVVPRNETTRLPLMSAPTVADGPDDDGVSETIRAELNNDLGNEQEEIAVTYEISLTHPSVTETTSYDLRIVIEDSKTPRGEATASDAITVTARDDRTATPATESASSTATDAPNERDTAEDTPTPGAATETEAGTPTQSTGPGFDAALAAVAVLSAAALFARRER